MYINEFMHIDTKNITEGLLLSSTNNTETLFEQSKTKPQETFEFKRTKQRDTSSFDVPMSIEDGEWMLCLTSLEVYFLFSKKLKQTMSLKIYRS